MRGKNGRRAKKARRPICLLNFCLPPICRRLKLHNYDILAFEQILVFLGQLVVADKHVDIFDMRKSERVDFAYFRAVEHHIHVPRLVENLP